MLQRLIASRLITPPAIWGKLPGHADFVRGNMRHGESDGWQPWLAQQARMEGASPVTPLPAAFVLPPGTLSFARRRFVLGVVMPSRDKVGRSHALLVYHLAHPRWVQSHFEAQAEEPQDWQFWLARAVARHGSGQAALGIHALERTVQGLWRMYAPHTRQLWTGQAVLRAAGQHSHTRALLDQLAGPAAGDDQASQLRGVRHFPLSDWPQCLFNNRSDGVFWQQDAAGGYVNVTTRLAALWGGT